MGVREAALDPLLGVLRVSLRDLLSVFVASRGSAIQLPSSRSSKLVGLRGEERDKLSVAPSLGFSAVANRRVSTDAVRERAAHAPSRSAGDVGGDDDDKEGGIRRGEQGLSLVAVPGARFA